MKTIKSSEIASYLFCPVCWWTERMNGVKITKTISKGEKYHNAIAENQSTARVLYTSIMILSLFIIILFLYRFLA